MPIAAFWFAAFSWWIEVFESVMSPAPVEYSYHIPEGWE
jgi:hypothetical protein